MCGITGVFNRHDPVDEKRLRASIQSLSHRGPDNISLYTDDLVGLGHARLSIIDLTTGNQPLFVRNGNLVLIVNGEIYNYIELRRELEKQGHAFATSSDSEVILHGYAQHGESFLSRLNGMFALALYDRAEKRLLLARDRLGIKPLFMAHLGAGVAFASEIKGILALDDRPVDINPGGLLQFLQNQFNSGKDTIITGYERVLPGEAVVIEGGVIRKRWFYWSAGDVLPAEMDYETAEKAFDELMETVMTEHMRSDVPFGLFLSGGVDSSVLLALLSRFKDEPIRTFSVGFADTRLFDELPAAEKLAKAFGSRHTSLRPTREEIFGSLPYTVWASDDLMRDYACLPTNLLARSAARELKVVFSGEGGDEVFAGYGRYRSSGVERWFKNLLRPGTGGMRTRGTFRGKWPGMLFGDRLGTSEKNTREPFKTAWQNTPGSWSTLKRMQYTDLMTALPDNLLVKLDRMLMGWGLEGRVPLLDHRVVEFGLSLPDSLKINGGHGKYFLKKWAARFLPEDHLFVPKRGFHVPVGEWLSDGLLLNRLQQILPENPVISGWFRPEGVKQVIRSCSKPNGTAPRMLMSLLQFAVWYGVFIRDKGQCPPVMTDPVDFIS